MSSPTQRSKDYLEKAGYTVAIVERWNHFSGTRQDLWGFADIIAFRIGMPVMLVQTTTGSNVAARRKKILANPIARRWVEAGHEVVLHGWALRGERGKRKLWTVDEWLILDQFGE
jgi:hypothetical protein